jgi:hypothetical protein
MKDSVPIPGMFISREDMELIYYRSHLKLDDEEAAKKSRELTDEQMDDIAYAFSEEFFDRRDGLFRYILIDAVNFLKENDTVLSED